ncbi:biliverdin-producing heme oxygenase [Flavobacterium sp. MAH-1]|uniref:Biliverdin-producing heme oxygenase n=1 Tax=Flavobacterium agri TaxID=2743471 RepID=A0A7Y8Y4F7_9FLAO|nr:biliverdin-producing heme oxygenase [Flavobacterium agri]NUY82136.1 biliverdin-producing heme oxygenase [Flavobacterium agri]NYA72160.1 biliverdin-producing heme oxygenase [Flavobacterium agri]
MTETIHPASFVEALRNETSIAHKKLEQLPVSAAILSRDVTTSDYGRYLRLMHDVVSSLERNVHPLISDVISDIDHRKKADHLKRDLHTIGFEPSENTNDPFIQADLTVPLSLGIAYVVEGSTLGGRFILKNIQQTLGFDENSGATYFAGYGNKTGSMWKTFLEQLTQYATQNSCEKDVIAGANFAFAAIHEHLSD